MGAESRIERYQRGQRFAYWILTPRRRSKVPEFFPGAWRTAQVRFLSDLPWQANLRDWSLQARTWPWPNQTSTWWIMVEYTVLFRSSKNACTLKSWSIEWDQKGKDSAPFFVIEHFRMGSSLLIQKKILLLTWGLLLSLTTEAFSLDLEGLLMGLLAKRQNCAFRHCPHSCFCGILPSSMPLQWYPVVLPTSFVNTINTINTFDRDRPW